MQKKLPFVFVGLFFLLGIFFISVLSNYIHDYFEVKKMKIPIEQSLMGDWVIELSDNVISTPIIKGNQLFVQTSSSIQSYDLQTRKMIWEATTRVNVRNCPPVITEKSIFVVDKDEILALDTKNGKFLWRSQIDGEDLVFEDIKVNGSRVFVAVHNGFFYSLDISDGQVVWKTQVEPRSTLRIFFDNRDVLVDSSSLLISYNQLSGVEMWKKPIRIENALMLSDLKTIIGINYDDDSSRLIGIDLSNGDILFSNQIQVQKVSCIVETTKGILLSGEDLTLFNLEADRVTWQNQQISNLGCPFVFKENVYVKKELRDIYKYSILTGTLQSRIPIKWESSSKSNYLIMPIEFNDWMIIETNLRRIEFFRQ